jgi:hypothetical protein
LAEWKRSYFLLDQHAPWKGVRRTWNRWVDAGARLGLPGCQRACPVDSGVDLWVCLGVCG